MDLTDLTPVALPLPHSERIKLFAWWLHRHGAREVFSPADIRGLYLRLHMDAPTSFAGYFPRLAARRVLLKRGGGYLLEAGARAELDARFAPAPATTMKVEISETLRALPSKLPTLNETKYLDEALICYEHGASRAAMVMTWNLAFAHLCDHILTNRLADFNATWLISLPGMHSGRKGVKTIAVMDDFNRYLKEQEVLDVARDASIITRNVHGSLEIGLTRRNMAAHPNDVLLNQLQVDAFIDDLVNNAVLKII